MDPYQQLRIYVSSFVPLSEEEWQAQLAYLQLKTLQKHDFLIREGQICPAIYFINRGSFRTYHLIKGKEVTTNFFFAGGFIADYGSLVRQKVSNEYIQALETAELVSLAYEHLEDLYRRFYNYQKFGRLINERVLINMQRRQQEFLLYTPKERYLHLLQHRPKVVLRLPQIYVASYLGITPEYLSRLRRELKKEHPSIS
ncbi:MAG: Crp/Fnr family transcriptional regulator [Bacteroidota bacterium]